MCVHGKRSRRRRRRRRRRRNERISRGDIEGTILKNVQCTIIFIIKIKNFFIKKSNFFLFIFFCTTAGHNNDNSIVAIGEYQLRGGGERHRGHRSVIYAGDVGGAVERVKSN